MKAAWSAILLLLAAGAVSAAQVEVFSPQGEVKGVRQMAVRFSDPMVAFGDPRLPEPFDIECSEPGTARWADQKNWVYEFGRDLPAGVRCSSGQRHHHLARSGHSGIGAAGALRDHAATGGLSLATEWRGNRRVR